MSKLYITLKSISMLHSYYSDSRNLTLNLVFVVKTIWNKTKQINKFMHYFQKKIINTFTKKSLWYHFSEVILGPYVTLTAHNWQKWTRRFSNHESRLLSRSHTFAIIVTLDLKIHQSMWIHWPFFPKTWTKGHWPLDDLWPHVCWGHMCDSTQGSLCPSPMKIHQSMWIQWTFFAKTWTKGHWPLDDLLPHICWGHMCDSTQGSLCPSPMGIHQCMWIQWSILQITTYILHTTYRMSDHIVSQARQKVHSLHVPAMKFIGKRQLV